VYRSGDNQLVQLITAAGGTVNVRIVALSIAAALCAGVQQYSLPISPASAPNFTIATQGNVTAVGADPRGTLSVGAANGQIRRYPPPLSAASTATLTFANGSGTVGQLFFDTAMYATTGGAGVNQYAAPFGVNPPSPITDPAVFTSYGVVRDGPGNTYISNVVVPDASGDLYVGNSANNTVTMYQPPFSPASAPAVTMPVGGGFNVLAIGIGP
jgi:hypothetical protein